LISVVLTLGVLSFFRWIEARMPSQAYYHFSGAASRAAPGMSERQLRELVESHGFSIANFTYRREPEGANSRAVNRNVVRHAKFLRGLCKTRTSPGPTAVKEPRLAGSWSLCVFDPPCDRRRFAGVFSALRAPITCRHLLSIARRDRLVPGTPLWMGGIFLRRLCQPPDISWTSLLP